MVTNIEIMTGLPALHISSEIPGLCLLLGIFVAVADPFSILKKIQDIIPNFGQKKSADAS